jgi:hypothetical protein
LTADGAAAGQEFHLLMLATNGAALYSEHLAKYNSDALLLLLLLLLAELLLLV